MAFTGRAVYDTDGTNTAFNGIYEDISDVISMISPSETPLLAALGDPEMPAFNVLHEWIEDALTPDTIASSQTLSDTITYIPAYAARHPQIGNNLGAGDVIYNGTTGEYMQITAASGNTITVTRGFGGSTAATITAGVSLTVVSPAALEGADVDNDVSMIRSRHTNYCQIFKKDIIVSGTMQSVRNVGVGNEFEYQIRQRSRELIRDLEKAVILSKLSGNTLGSSTAYRTMRGLWDFISTNNTSVATLSASVLDDIIQAAWGNGAAGLNLIVADPTWKRSIDGLNASRVEVVNGDERFHQRVTRYSGSFGDFPVIASRWMPSKSVMVIDTERVKVLPLARRSFQFQKVAQTGDAEKGMIVGEYTLEVKNEEGLAKAHA